MMKTLCDRASPPSSSGNRPAVRRDVSSTTPEPTEQIEWLVGFEGELGFFGDAGHATLEIRHPSAEDDPRVDRSGLHPSHGCGLDAQSSSEKSAGLGPTSASSATGRPSLSKQYSSPTPRDPREAPTDTPSISSVGPAMEGSSRLRPYIADVGIPLMPRNQLEQEFRVAIVTQISPVEETCSHREHVTGNLRHCVTKVLLGKTEGPLSRRSRESILR